MPLLTEFSIHHILECCKVGPFVKETSGGSWEWPFQAHSIFFCHFHENFWMPVRWHRRDPTWIMTIWFPSSERRKLLISLTSTTIGRTVIRPATDQGWSGFTGPWNFFKVFWRLPLHLNCMGRPKGLRRFTEKHIWKIFYRGDRKIGTPVTPREPMGQNFFLRKYSLEKLVWARRAHT